MSDWRQRAAVEIVNAYATIYEGGDVPRAEIEAFVADAIARHSPAMEDEWPSIESVGDHHIIDTEKVTRVELIDHRNESKAFGRAFVAWDVSANMSIQDQGRTMKVFVTDRRTND